MSWANQYAPESVKIRGLDDKSLCNGLLFLYVINGIAPKSIDFEAVQDGKSEESRIANINLGLASARKIGAQVVTLWEHVLSCNSRFISLLLAELQYISKRQSK